MNAEVIHSSPHATLYPSHSKSAPAVEQKTAMPVIDYLARIVDSSYFRVAVLIVGGVTLVAMAALLFSISAVAWLMPGFLFIGLATIVTGFSMGFTILRDKRKNHLKEQTKLSGEIISGNRVEEHQRVRRRNITKLKKKK